jgi:hypothetical protein
MDANQQVALQIGTLALANIQLAAQAQELQKQVQELQRQLDALRPKDPEQYPDKREFVGNSA